jgi:hypothetical protein
MWRNFFLFLSKARVVGHTKNVLWKDLPLEILCMIKKHVQMPCIQLYVPICSVCINTIYLPINPVSNAPSITYYEKGKDYPKNSFFEACASMASTWWYSPTRIVEKSFTRGQKQQQKQHAKKIRSQTRRHFNAKNPKIQNQKK